MRSATERLVGCAGQGELDQQHGAYVLAFGVMADALDAAAGKQRGVELRRLEGLVVVSRAGADLGRVTHARSRCGLRPWRLRS